MEFDLSKLYRTVTEEIEINDYILSVTVREVPHGDFVELQKRMMGDLTLSTNKRDMERQIQSIRFSAPQFADEKNMLAIQDWSIQNGTGEPVPLPRTLDTWRKLPHSVTEQIEKVVERLNPDLDEEFQS